ncbi:HDIG domain-containing protein [Methylobacterium phyllostachyos]|uniref:HDIG domain-containing protein n=1 Tax=Methylobacterium phyllostachyos TaxID=582672 RepID=A0A1H0JSV5_9HYPH|nr:HD domain-containing phosphohydrolase [Methylobacterium phyllostachyos]SDO46875.1 HDIG domain-containing protein [Methylobacterium phyllostachyos]
MGALLLITDDVQRGQRLARNLDARGPCHVHELYEDKLPPPQFDLIVSDIEALTSDALIRLRRVLAAMRGGEIPYLFLVHGNVARAEAQAQILGASATLSSTAGTQQLLDALGRMHVQIQPTPASVWKQATEARHFLKQVLLSGAPITPAIADTGTDLVARAVGESGIYDWVRAVQQFDDATHQHCLLVAALAAAFSGVLGLRAADRHRLTKAALLHDVGKIHVPTQILNKPGKLTEAEMAVMRTHPVRGHAMLVGQGFEAVMLTVVRSHHEMLDGTGYPDGLTGWEIPDLVRLVTVCDVYGALIERRPYRAPMAGEKAYAILNGMTGRLDDDLVRAFRPIAAVFDPSPRKMAHSQTLIPRPQQVPPCQDQEVSTSR